MRAGFDLGGRTLSLRSNARDDDSSPRALIHITPRRGLDSSAFVEMWQARDLLWILAWRDFRVRYRQTAFGVAWALIPPVFTAAVFSAVFGRFAGVPSDNLPYPVFAFAGLVPWQLFSTSLTQASNSMVGNQSLITKVYFPRMLIPLSAILGCIPDLVIACLVLVGFTTQYLRLRSALLTLPLFVLLGLLLAVGIGLWLSALNVEYRDVRHAVPFVVQLWMFLTPLAYPSTIVPAQWRWALGLNPMASVVDGFRWALFGSVPLARTRLLVSCAVVLGILCLGVFWFQRTEKQFADTI